MQASLYTVKGIIVLDNDGKRILAKVWIAMIAGQAESVVVVSRTILETSAVIECVMSNRSVFDTGSDVEILFISSRRSSTTTTALPR